MIARHRQPWRGQAIEERLRRAELAEPRALGQVAADRDQIGRVVVQFGLQRGDDRRIVRPEVQVRDVCETW